MGARAVAVALWAALGAGCGDLGPRTGPEADLERAELRWATEGPPSYVYAVERICFCGVGARGPVRVRVQDGAVAERAYVDSGDPVPHALAELFPTVEGVFDLVRDALASGAHTVQVTYDPELGVPVDLWIDYHAQAADEELGMRVTEGLEALP